MVRKKTDAIYIGQESTDRSDYFGRDEHRDNLNTTVFLAVMILDSKSVCRTSGSKPVHDDTTRLHREA